jgi:hypothetical protein
MIAQVEIPLPYSFYIEENTILNPYKYQLNTYEIIIKQPCYTNNGQLLDEQVTINKNKASNVNTLIIEFRKKEFDR